MYTNEDIQEIITKVRNDLGLSKKVLDQITDYSDWKAVQNVIDDGWYEAFDRYDSDVCEQFIKAYEQATQ